MELKKKKFKKQNGQRAAKVMELKYVMVLNNFPSNFKTNIH